MPITGTQIKNKIVPIAATDCIPSSIKNPLRGNKLVPATPIPNKAAKILIPTTPKTKNTNTFIIIVISFPIKCKNPVFCAGAFIFC